MTSLTYATFLALQAASGGSPMVGFIIQMGAIFAIFYFLMIRPQQKQRRQHEERLRNLRKGDAVVTAGGMIGEVLHIRETAGADGPKKSMDDPVTIKSGDARVVVERGRIARVSGEAASSSPDK